MISLGLGWVLIQVNRNLKSIGRINSDNKNCTKFDVKQGNILSSERVFRRKRGELGGRYLKLYLIYNLLFEDDMGRDIPVLVNHFNYRSFKNLEHPTEAMLIRYKCGKTLLFDVARI